MSDWTCTGQSVPTARKDHTCHLCGRAIPKGEKHICRNGIVSGKGRVSVRMHLKCEEVARDWDEMDWENFTPGDIDALFQGVTEEVGQ